MISVLVIGLEMLLHFYNSLIFYLASEEETEEIDQYNEWSSLRFLFSEILTKRESAKLLSSLQR